MQSSIFMILLIPRRPGPVFLPDDSLSPLYIIAEGEPDNTVAILHHVLLIMMQSLSLSMPLHRICTVSVVLKPKLLRP
jgi:hypothetical protein